MTIKSYYKSPIGDIVIAASDDCITHVLFTDDKKINSLDEIGISTNHLIEDCKRYLDEYFKGNIIPLPKIKLPDDEFSKNVFNEVLNIKFGQVKTYGEIADILVKKAFIKPSKLLALRVGQAISKNNNLILMPCHRVVGADKKIVGYRGGIERKEFLLKQIEKSI